MQSLHLTIGSHPLKLIKEIKACTNCKDLLPHEPRPVVSFSTTSRILVVGQAPGTKVHKSGIPWDDASGKRLREWLGVTPEQFYDPKQFGIVPMGFCYPGKGKSGDLPPRPECAALWMDRVLKTLKNRELTLLIGQYSQRYFLGDRLNENLTSTVKGFRDYAPEFVVLPHPSPRNNIWLRKNPWFESENLPYLKRRIKRSLNGI